MTDELQQKISILTKLIENAEESIATARELMNQLTGQEMAPRNGNGNGNGHSKKPLNGLSLSSDGRVIEGVFDGESMVGPDGRRYPVPPNYASKSKLVNGDILKLTIAENGSFIYKQIGPVERVQEVGVLKKIGGDYLVTAPEAEFRVLTASVTYFKASPGDQVTIIIPVGAKNGWAAIENVIPKIVRIDSLDHEDDTRPTIATKVHEIEDFEIPKTLFRRKV